MNSLIYYALEIDFVCLFVFVLVAVVALTSGDRNKYLYVGLIACFCLQCLLDMSFHYFSSLNCHLNLIKSGICKLNLDLVFLCSNVLLFCNLLTPFVIFLVSYLSASSNVTTREAKLLFLSIPFVVLSYYTLSTSFNGYIQFKTFHGEIVKGKYYTFLVATVGLYSILGLINVLNIFSSKKELIGQIIESKIDLVLMYVVISLPFIFAPINLIVDVSVVIPCYAISFMFLMTIHQHLRVSIDDLTSVNNRNELNSYLDNLMVLPEKDRRSTFMLFIDVNKFKFINDNYGHNEGDEVLIEISRLLKAVAGTFNCFVCRYGGDEFILIKRHANEEKATNLCKFIDKSVADLKRLSLAPYELSVSTGFVRFDNRFKTPKDFIDAADKLMYETKRNSKKVLKFN